MRIKCPYSDVMLELPGDRTDMKFTCPSCHRVHRVTVRISTPEDDPAPEPRNTRTINRATAQIPKKYATGAYAPVVDIPIDANFVLLDDATKRQKGVDLGLAAAPDAASILDRELSSRKTEVVSDRRPPKAEKPSAPAREEPAPSPEPVSAPEPTPPEKPRPQPEPTSVREETPAPPLPEFENAAVEEETDKPADTMESGPVFTFAELQTEEPAAAGGDGPENEMAASAPPPPLADDPVARPTAEEERPDVIEPLPPPEPDVRFQDIFETSPEAPAAPMPGLVDIGLAPEPEPKAETAAAAGMAVPKFADAPKFLHPLPEPAPEKVAEPEPVKDAAPLWPREEAMDEAPDNRVAAGGLAAASASDVAPNLEERHERPAPAPEAPQVDVRESAGPVEAPLREPSAAAPDVPEKTPPAPEAPPLPSSRTSDRHAAVSGRGTTTRTVHPDVAISSRKNRKKTKAMTAYAVLVAVLAVGGFFGWQQHRYSQAMEEARESLSQADRAWDGGDARTAVTSATNAQSALERGAGITTAGSLWAKDGSGQIAELDGKVRKYLDRDRALTSFRNSLNPSDGDGMVELLSGTLSTVKDPPLAKAMEKVAVDESIAFLNGNAEIMSPEDARARARRDFQLLGPYLSEAGRTRYFDEVSAFNDVQRRRLADEARAEIAGISAAAAEGDPSALVRYRSLVERLRSADIPELSGPVDDLGESDDRDSLVQLATLSELVDRAVSSARSVLSRNVGDETEIDNLIDAARGEDYPNPSMAEAAAQLVDEARTQSDDLVNLKNELISRLQTEMRRNRENAGTRLALSMIRIASDDPGVEIDPQGFNFDSNRASMNFSIDGLPAFIEMNEGDYEKRVRATVGGYNFTSGWALLFHKPVSWMVRMAKDMRAAGIDSDRHHDWEILEGPGGIMAMSASANLGSGLALADPAADARRVFWEGRMLPVNELPQPTDARRVVEDFRKAAEKLQEVVMASSSIPQTLRQALRPILMGAYQPPDPRDYFDSAFCRRLIEADYLETYIKPMPNDVVSALDLYRVALSKLEAGYDEFSVGLEDGSTVYAVVNLDADFSSSGKGSDQDPETGESLPKYSWRVEKPGETVFYSPMPSRFVYAFMLAEYYDGTVQTRPEGVPRLTEVSHVTQGRIASYKDGDNRAIGDAELWNAAVAEDSNGRFDPSVGPPGWNFPVHVLQRDDQGDPVLMATLSGVVMSPNFSGHGDENKRRAAEDAWLDSTAKTLSTPGELGLIFHQFFRYCSDSPLPELPNLIGSHYGLSDTHQTVYESLERRWVGRLIGDCDDLAEFFQELTSRQGKLSHVMQLPGHAAAGYVDKVGDGNYRFIVLQTGPVLQFNAPSLNEAVEIAYRSFDRGEGLSHMTTDAVPLLLRFANEETRTPFVLSARIYGDAEYAKTMIQVQSYWHEHVYSAAIKVMESLVEEDKEIGNIKELGSLYERVGFYERSAELRLQELSMVRDNPQAAISTLLELVQLYIQDKDKDKALEALGQMEGMMQDMIRKDDAEGFFRAITFRSFWAMYLARLGQPARAWNLMRYDATLTKRQLGRVADPVLRTMVFMYERMCMDSAAKGGNVSEDFRKAMDEVRNELEEAFGKGYFKSDDSYNAVLGRYFTMGRYAVSDFGRKSGLERLLADGPYPSSPKDQNRRTPRGVQDDDWQWFRITPQLYYALAMEMLDQDEFPELYDPDAARPILEGVERAVDKGTGLGSDVAGGDDVIKADLTLAFLNRDLQAFRVCMATVKEKDYSSLYDDAAMTFGLQCGLIPLNDFQKWIDAFHEFFPGSQHYFKVVYRAIDKENYDHALMMAEATPRFFPGRPLLSRERDFVRSIIPELKQRKTPTLPAETETVETETSEIPLVPVAEDEMPAA